MKNIGNVVHDLKEYFNKYYYQEFINTIKQLCINYNFTDNDINLHYLQYPFYEMSNSELINKCHILELNLKDKYNNNMYLIDEFNILLKRNSEIPNLELTNDNLEEINIPKLQKSFNNDLIIKYYFKEIKYLLNKNNLDHYQINFSNYIKLNFINYKSYFNKSFIININKYLKNNFIICNISNTHGFNLYFSKNTNNIKTIKSLIDELRTKNKVLDKLKIKNKEKNNMQNIINQNIKYLIEIEKKLNYD